MRLLVEDTANTFKTSIGNVPPKSEVIISIVYITELQFNSDQKVIIPILPSIFFPSLSLFLLILNMLVGVYYPNKHEGFPRRSDQPTLRHSNCEE